MALPATCVHEVQTGGSDTLNGGHFDPSNVNMATDLAATSATGNSPVVTSASYNFVAGDVGAWLFVKAGTNWTPGWYQIASVAANAATLSAAIGAALSANYVPNTAAGCATTASPTGGTWAIDYSQGTSAISLTGLTTAAANAIILTASATVAMVGNGIYVKSGTNFTVGIYNISSVSAGVSITVDHNCTFAAGSAGTAGVGGCLASPGMAAGAVVSGNILWIQYNATAYTISSSTAHVAGGTVQPLAGGIAGGAPLQIIGYDTLRNLTTIFSNRPTIKAGVDTITCLQTQTLGGTVVRNIIVDGDKANRTAINGINAQGVLLVNCQAKNCNQTYGIQAAFNSITIYCQVNSCSFSANNTAFNVQDSTAIFCTATGNGNGATPNFVFSMSNAGGKCIGCIAYANTASAAIGFRISNSGNSGSYLLLGCVAYNNGNDGFSVTMSGTKAQVSWINCIAALNGGYGFDSADAVPNCHLAMNCATYSNTSSAFNAVSPQVSCVTLSGDPFTSGAGGNFSLNNTAGAGVACRAAGIPGAFPGISTTGYLDIGAAQHQDTGNSGTGSRIIGPALIEL